MLREQRFVGWFAHSKSIHEYFDVIVIEFNKMQNNIDTLNLPPVCHLQNQTTPDFVVRFILCLRQNRFLERRKALGRLKFTLGAPHRRITAPR